jgi:hypothetical protein
VSLSLLRITYCVLRITYCVLRITPDDWRKTKSIDKSHKRRHTSDAQETSREESQTVYKECRIAILCPASTTDLGLLYAITHYTNGQVVTAGEACTFWQPWIDMIALSSPHLLSPCPKFMAQLSATNEPSRLPTLLFLTQRGKSAIHWAVWWANVAWFWYEIYQDEVGELFWYHGLFFESARQVYH